ncbi:MAG: carboxypeptidase regulatory-like domain-containing protein [Bacteroidota bacterium]
MKKCILTLLLMNAIFIVFAQNLSISGNISTENGDPICDVTVRLLGENDNELAVLFTDENGDYSFGNLESRKTYYLTISKDSHVLNGVSTFDIIQLINHILDNQRLETPLKIYSLDVNNSSFLSVSDAILLRKVILGVDAEFPTKSWRFLSSDTQIGENNPWAVGNPHIKVFKNLTASIDDSNFIGVKTGDANGSAATGCN